MQVFKRFASGHEDFVHDVCYDFYGKRLASCSSDRAIKVWEQDGAGGWRVQSEIAEAHRGPVWKLAWAHPQFGQVIASSSFDRTVGVWEEQEGFSTDGTKCLKWSKRADLADSRDSVQAIEFAPRHLGLILATASADGTVRLYENTDVTKMHVWAPAGEFSPASEGGVTCMSWCPSPFVNAMLAVGTSGAAEQRDAAAATGAGGGGGGAAAGGGGGGQAAAAAAAAAAASGARGGAQLWQRDERGRWNFVASLRDDADIVAAHKGRVHDIAWAPHMGRSFHRLATAGQDQTVRVWEVRAAAAAGGAAASGRAFEVSQVACLRQHKAEVWRVEWNITGTVLASSGDDGVARLWRSSIQGVWQCVGEICHE